MGADVETAPDLITRSGFLGWSMTSSPPRHLIVTCLRVAAAVVTLVAPAGTTRRFSAASNLDWRPVEQGPTIPTGRSAA